MATQQETLEKLNAAADNAEKINIAYGEVLTADENTDIDLGDGTTTPSLSKRVKQFGGQVFNVAGLTGDVTTEELTEALELGSAAKYDAGDLPIPNAQKNINKLGGVDYWHNENKPYPLNGEVRLENGNIVRSTIPNNTNDPNTNMVGWVNPELEQEKKNSETVSTADYGSIGDGTLHTVREWLNSGKYPSLNAIQIKYPHVTSLDNSIDWAATQKACDVQKKHGSVKIIGCLFFNSSETLQLKVGQRIYGLNSGWFVNTNNGTQFTGALTGDIPEYGIYSDRTSGSVIIAPEANQFEGFTLFGKGYTLADGSIDILHPADAEIYPTVGIEANKFIITNNFSCFYFGTSVKSVGGNYYSRFDKTEITRCAVAFDYLEATYAQSFYGCVIRQVPTPFKFLGYARSFNYYGGSIEGFFNRTDYCVGIQPRSELGFWGVYFETFNPIATKTVFKFLGGQSLLNFKGCSIYLQHVEKFVDVVGTTRTKISSSDNEFLVGTDTVVYSPIIYNIPVNEFDSAHELGLDFIRFDAAYPNIATRTGSITAGQKTLTVSDTTGFETGVRVHIVGAGLGGVDLQTVVISRSGSVVTLRDAAAITVSNAIIKQYWIPQYHQYGTGTGLSHSKIEYPRDYIPLFDKIEFKRNGGVIQAQKAPPTNQFNGGAVGSVQLVADGVTWNPSGRSDAALGAYPVAYRGGRYFPMLGSFSGSFTFPAGTSATVANINVAASSKIVPIPTNAAAATLLKNGWFISAKNNATSFVMTTQTSALGTETFDYTITD